jgi:hypothetical protein
VIWGAALERPLRMGASFLTETIYYFQVIATLNCSSRLQPLVMEFLYMALTAIISFMRTVSIG